ncbi:hypothetical protein BaRGS_00017560 [Batillaria attramentaria]|uniref:RING-type domain-containing protein n=1 Tax=Batillaria attramentaria TaxID=370345 RepID=A0ABD0KWL7_9CAEN
MTCTGLSNNGNSRTRNAMYSAADHRADSLVRSQPNSKQEQRSVGPQSASALGTSHLSQKDAMLLEEPAVQAVQSFGDYSQDVLLKAVHTLKSQKSALSAENLLEALDKLTSHKHPIKPVVSRRKENHQDELSSDGEEPGSLPYFKSDEPQSMLGDDVEADGECVPPPAPKVFDELEATVKSGEPVVKREVRSNAETDIHTLRKKVKLLKSENRHLKERSLCKHCRSKPVSITFLPCGHYSYCYDCGQTFNACPICKKTILADVRTFLA